MRHHGARHPRLQTVLACAAVFVLLLFGYWFAYVHYPRFRLPPIDALSLVALALLAGLASLLSPCSFPLFLATLARRASREGEGNARQLIGVGLGASSVFLLLGGAIAAGVAPLIAGVTFPSVAGRILRFAVALALVGLAAAQRGWWSLPGTLVSRTGRRLLRAGEQPSVLRSVAAGTGYVLAGFG